MPGMTTDPDLGNEPRLFVTQVQLANGERASLVVAAFDTAHAIGIVEDYLYRAGHGRVTTRTVYPEGPGLWLGNTDGPGIEGTHGTTGSLTVARIWGPDGQPYVAVPVDSDESS